MKKTLFAAAAFAALSMAATAQAAVITLTFEGIGDLQAVGNYYNGGAGTNYGVSFSGPTLALIDADAGGSGNFANEPTKDTIMFFLQSNNAILDFAAGFTTGFSFFYTSSTAATINVWSGVGATGSILGSINLAAQHTANNCTGDPSGTFCNWDPIGVTFAGTARSIDFGGTANQTGYDNITFGSSKPGSGAVPEPATWAMMLLGFGGMGAVLRSRRRFVAV